MYNNGAVMTQKRGPITPSKIQTAQNINLSIFQLIILGTFQAGGTPYGHLKTPVR